MSEAAEEEVMKESPVVSEEEEEEEEEEQPGGDTQTPSKAAAGGGIMEGKRVKKTVERLDLQAPKQREKIRIGDGSGDKLGEITRTNHHITKMKPADLKPLHTILFDRPGKISTMKKNLRLFNGFPFDSDSEQFTKKREKLLKNSNFTNSKLKVVCSVLDLEKKGTHSDLVDRILAFLVAPKNSGKRLPVKKKRKSKKKLSGDDDSVVKTKKKNKPKAKSSSTSPKKSKAGSKSKAIVMDSSSDEEEKAEQKPSQKEEEEEEGEEEEEEHQSESEESSSEEEPAKSKPGRAKPAPKKPARTPPRKSGKRARKDSDESDSEQEKPRKKKSAASKPAAKSKKADSSSNSKNTNTAEDSSDEDEPLIKMIKKAPSEEQLKQTVQALLKEANLEEMTMKQICQRVFETYPEHDLSGRKDFIKQTVKSLIT